MLRGIRPCYRGRAWCQKSSRFPFPPPAARPPAEGDARFVPPPAQVPPGRRGPTRSTHPARWSNFVHWHRGHPLVYNVMQVIGAIRGPLAPRVVALATRGASGPHPPTATHNPIRVLTAVVRRVADSLCSDFFQARAAFPHARGKPRWPKISSRLFEQRRETSPHRCSISR